MRVSAFSAGTLFFLSFLALGADSADVSLKLAEELYAEGRWRDCVIEAVRRLECRPNDMRAIFLKAASELNSGIDSTPALLFVFSNEETDLPTKLDAAYEIARKLWKDGKPEEALNYYWVIFNSAENHDRFISAACSISIILRDYRKIAVKNQSLKLQVRTCYPFFSPQLRDACDPRRQKDGLASLLFGGMVRFYQKNISPAIGDRCSLDPSCSAYAIQALRRHGPLGLALYADRGYREPDVVAKREKVVVKKNGVKIADPLDDHDWWMRGIVW